MGHLQGPDSRTVKRLGRQIDLLLISYHAELAKDPDSYATKSSRSNVIALWHTIRLIYGGFADDAL